MDNNEECEICYEELKNKVFLHCGHYMCITCYEKISNTCPFCRTPIASKIEEEQKIEVMENDPDYWLDYSNREWVTYSRILRNGNEIIQSFRASQVPDNWRNNDMITIVKRRRQRTRREGRRKKTK